MSTQSTTRREQRHFPGRADQVALARAFVSRPLARHPETRDTVALLVSEAVTNALLHSASGRGGGTIEIRYDRRGDLLRIDVVDQGGELAPRRRIHHPESMTGRGLWLFDVLADRWGVTGDAAGRTVWFEVTVGKEAVGGAGPRAV